MEVSQPINADFEVPMDTVPRTTGIGTAHVMLRHAGPPDHPERPERLQAVLSRFQKDNLWDHVVRLPVRAAHQPDLLRVHSKELVDAVYAMDPSDPACPYNKPGGDLYANAKTLKSARFAAGTVMQCVDAVMKKHVKNAFAAVRPPGHHATRDQSMGFCYFCNCAVAAQHALDTYPEEIQRVLIVDWDIHHGNGIEDIFYDRNDVLYISTHRFDEGRYYPQTGMLERVGSGDGEGFNVNIPFAQRAGPYGDADFYAVFLQLVMPIAQTYNPDLVIVAAGFDAASGDDLGGFDVSPACFAHCTALLKTLAEGRLVMALEGGYNTDSVADCVSACVDVLMGNAPPAIEMGAPSKYAFRTMNQVANAYAKYWKCLQPFSTEFHMRMLQAQGAVAFEVEKPMTEIDLATAVANEAEAVPLTEEEFLEEEEDEESASDADFEAEASSSSGSSGSGEPVQMSEFKVTSEQHLAVMNDLMTPILESLKEISMKRTKPDEPSSVHPACLRAVMPALEQWLRSTVYPRTTLLYEGVDDEEDYENEKLIDWYNNRFRFRIEEVFMEKLSVIRLGINITAGALHVALRSRLVLKHTANDRGLYAFCKQVTSLPLYAFVPKSG